MHAKARVKFSLTLVFPHNFFTYSCDFTEPQLGESVSGVLSPCAIYFSEELILFALVMLSRCCSSQKWEVKRKCQQTRTSFIQAFRV